MNTFFLRPGLRSRRVVASLVVALVVSAAGVSAHRVIGRNYPAVATALVQSPTASPSELPVPIFTSGLSVICLRVTNTSSVDTRITAIGLELPGTLSGFALLSPLDYGLSVFENVEQVPGFPDVTLDFVLATGNGFTGGRPRLGLPPSTTPTQFCVSGPFSTTTAIETMLNGVFVRFEGAGSFQNVSDIAVWERRPR
jgi:hypothetical protein